MIVISDTTPILSLMKGPVSDRRTQGRRVAKQLKAKYIGTAGILMLAYDKGHIGQAEVQNSLDAMISSNIRLDKKICNIVMAHIGLDKRY